MRVMGSPIKSAQIRAAVALSIFVNKQDASKAPKAHLLKRPKDQILGWLLLGGTTILHTSKPNHRSEMDQDDVVTEEVLKVAPGLACGLRQAVETSPEPACETNDGTEKSVQVQLLMHHEGTQKDEKKIVSSTAMQTEPYSCFSGGEPRLEERSSTMPFCPGQPVWLRSFHSRPKWLPGVEYPRGSDGDCAYAGRRATSSCESTAAAHPEGVEHGAARGALQHPPPPLTKPRRCQPAWLTPRRQGRRPLANLKHRHRFAGPTGYGDHLNGSTGKRGRCATPCKRVVNVVMTSSPSPST
ncbi:hypothetical protein MRX96_055536 [Rhipicephalus microplus]